MERRNCCRYIDGFYTTSYLFGSGGAHKEIESETIHNALLSNSDRVENLSGQGGGAYRNSE
eukprot:gene34720-42825_t